MINRLRELHSTGGTREIIRGVNDFIYYNSKHFYEGIQIKYLKQRFGRYYDVQLPDYTLTVDLDDRGIGQALALNGIREPHSYKKYRECLKKLDNTDKSDLTVIEIGANIGYYALLPPALCENVEVYAAELSEENTEMLKKNTKKNNLEDHFKIDNVALSDSTQKTTAYLSSDSNCHSLNSLASKNSTTEEKEINTLGVDDWLQQHGLQQSDIDVLRMDVEGSEYKILPALDNIDPDLIHIELHPKFMEPNQIEKVFKWVENSSLSAVCVANETKLYDNDVDLRTLPPSVCPECVLF